MSSLIIAISNKLLDKKIQFLLINLYFGGHLPMMNLYSAVISLKILKCTKHSKNCMKSHKFIMIDITIIQTNVNELFQDKMGLFIASCDYDLQQIFWWPSVPIFWGPMVKIVIFFRTKYPS